MLLSHVCIEYSLQYFAKLVTIIYGSDRSGCILQLDIVTMNCFKSARGTFSLPIVSTPTTLRCIHRPTPSGLST